MRPKTILAGGSGTDTSRKDSCAGTVILIRLESRSLCGDDGPNAVRLLQRKAEDGEVQTSQNKKSRLEGSPAPWPPRDTLTHEGSFFFVSHIRTLSRYFRLLFCAIPLSLA